MSVDVDKLTDQQDSAGRPMGASEMKPEEMSREELIARLRELEADNARLRKQDKGSTHHADCYRQHGHHECAMRVIDQLRADNAKLREYVGHLVFVSDQHGAGEDQQHLSCCAVSNQNQYGELAGESCTCGLAELL